MDEIFLSKCRCGGDTEFLLEQSGTRVFAQCKLCGIRTPSRAASLEYAAKQQVADIWNCGTVRWPRWIRPAVAEDAYSEGARVSHTTGEGGAWEHWISNRGGNIWEPGESGWTLVGPAPTE